MFRIFSLVGPICTTTSTSLSNPAGLELMSNSMIEQRIELQSTSSEWSHVLARPWACKRDVKYTTTKGNRQKIEFCFDFPAHAKNCLGWPQMEPGGSFSG